jgi:RNA polymerase sigma factor (sigma-70 family)
VTPREGFEAVLAAARAGREWAWAEIYRDLAPPLLGYLRARGAEEPEDLLGELFLQMVRDLAAFEGGERQFRAWAFAIAHHRLIDDRRYRGRRPVDPAPLDALDAIQANADRWAESTQGIGDRRVRAALGRLPEPQRNVILLRVLGDLSVDQAARVIGKTPGAVKALQRRALASLQRQLSKSSVTL